MNRRSVPKFLSATLLRFGLALTLGAIPPIAASAAEATTSSLVNGTTYVLGGERHLFIDDMGLSELRDIRFVVNPPTVHGLVIPRAEFEVETYSSVVDDGSGTYKLYYLEKHGSEPTGPGFDGLTNWFIALATSMDGLHWERPKLGLIEYQGSKDNNFVIRHAAMGSVYFDPHDPNPEYRYKYMSEFTMDNKPDTKTTEGVVIYTSPDGIHFTKNEFALFPGVIGSYRSESQINLLYDPVIKKYVAYMRGYAQGDGERRRTVLRAETDDPLQPWPFWKNPNPYFLRPDKPDDELPFMDRELETVIAADMDDPPNTDMYNAQVFLYPWAHRVYLAFPTWYYHTNKDRTYMRELFQIKDAARSDVATQWNSGTGEVQLMVSRDGRRWTRYRQPAYVKSGWYGDHYSYWSWLYQGMIRQGDKLLQYGTLQPAGHRGIEFAEGSSKALTGVVCFEQQADRFVGIEFDYTGGRVITEPLTFEGNRLVLNVDTGGMGEGRVGIIRANGARLPGYEVEDCDIINGDWFEKTVSWKKGNKDVAVLAGQPVRLVFDMRHARLFAMQFQQRDEPNTPGWEARP